MAGAMRMSQQVLLGLGYAILFLSHVMILANGLPQKSVQMHAWVNLVAFAMIVYGSYNMFEKKD